MNDSIAQFSETYIPKQIFVVETIHNVVNNAEQLKFVPKDILESALKAIGFDASHSETIMFVAVHNTEEDNWDGIVLYTHDRGDNAKKDVRLVIKGQAEKDVKLNNKMNILRIQYDPEWHGEKKDAITLEADTYKGMLEQLEKVHLKEQFSDIVMTGTREDISGEGSKGFALESGEHELTATEVPSTPVRHLKPAMPLKQVEKIEMTKNGKIPSARRKILVERFGEKNIKDLETRIANKLKGNES